MIKRESKRRSLLKAITWRIFGAIDTAAISWFITGDLTSGLNMGLADIIAKILFFVAHDQLWEKFSFKKQNLRRGSNKKFHLIKAITWRIFSSGLTVLLGWIILKNPLTGLKIGILEFFTKIILYYFHERLWFKTDFGMKEKKLN